MTTVPIVSRAPLKIHFYTPMPAARHGNVVSSYNQYWILLLLCFFIKEWTVRIATQGNQTTNPAGITIEESDIVILVGWFMVWRNSANPQQPKTTNSVAMLQAATTILPPPWTRSENKSCLQYQQVFFCSQSASQAKVKSRIHMKNEVKKPLPTSIYWILNDGGSRRAGSWAASYTHTHTPELAGLNMIRMSVCLCVGTTQINIIYSDAHYFRKSK